ncbi:2-dehydropantoate 2-reductase [Lachnospiraceae bacterium BX10]|jgi:2-dehydropantoate 2-reductase|uniref:2-dehydropantoate 2-reductase n=1 Tax=Enterocloster hominis (ex Liu et al. 2021) TaxID=2763663 RepID=A0ABR7NV63_9FIRM|nr:2-dehydropantoate 2-reductase [Enterocloster hominis]MBC8600010.1 2-dehydropantoate 2-reductase [Enterocloster hominis]MEE0222339.1 2-dehydropantoate 2-reductase [Lachnospiraceae bacterium]CDC50401.1 2-dehydropantoate 2-reductase [Clostridium sp. CAG:58]
MKPMKKVTLIGLGAMGVFFAPRISEKLGAGFRIMASGARKDRLEQKGVTVNGINYRFPIVTPEDNDGPSDLVIIAVKGYDLAQALKDIKYQVGPETIILPVLNGIDSEKQTADVYGQEHVLYSYMRVSIAMKDGKAEFDPEKGLIHFGEEKNDPGHFSDKVLAVKELFDRCGIDYKIDPDMIKGLWFKFMCNVGENMTCAMFGIPFGAFQKSADANYFRRAAMWEVIRVANRLGVDIGQNEIDRQEHTIGRLPYQNKPSTLQDLEAGKHTEVDMFAGTVVRLGKELGVETPVCEMFWHGIHLIEDRIFGNI